MTALHNFFNHSLIETIFLKLYLQYLIYSVIMFPWKKDQDRLAI